MNPNPDDEPLDLDLDGFYRARKPQPAAPTAADWEDAWHDLGIEWPRETT